jgi:dihydroorotase
VVPSGCITVGRAGVALAPLADLARNGVKIFTDDGSGVQDPAIMRRAMEYSRELGITLAQHCEVSALTAGAVMNECSCSSEMGVPGWPALAEELMVHRSLVRVFTFCIYRLRGACTWCAKLRRRDYQSRRK